jgi:hypothetical protein
MKLKQNLTIDDFHVVNTPAYIPWENLVDVLGKRRYKRFMRWMSGQTTTVNGVYPHDLERWLKNLPVIH